MRGPLLLVFGLIPYFERQGCGLLQALRAILILHDEGTTGKCAHTVLDGLFLTTPCVLRGGFSPQVMLNMGFLRKRKK